MSREAAAQSTPPEELERQIMSSNVGKNEREWWAAAEIERLRALLAPSEDDVAAAGEILLTAFRAPGELCVAMYELGNMIAQALAAARARQRGAAIPEGYRLIYVGPEWLCKCNYSNFGPICTKCGTPNPNWSPPTKGHARNSP